mmetsp:Transcript_46416/g.115519  ORF Transcript_46416/g.115519 Transcript_46416/m.115519 type:complete len:276 (+) Transcript_46416:1161-1988(+)
MKAMSGVWNIRVKVLLNCDLMVHSYEALSRAQKALSGCFMPWACFFSMDASAYLVLCGRIIMGTSWKFLAMSIRSFCITLPHLSLKLPPAKDTTHSWAFSCLSFSLAHSLFICLKSHPLCSWQYRHTLMPSSLKRMSCAQLMAMSPLFSPSPPPSAPTIMPRLIGWPSSSTKACFIAVRSTRRREGTSSCASVIFLMALGKWEGSLASVLMMSAAAAAAGCGAAGCGAGGASCCFSCCPCCCWSSSVSSATSSPSACCELPSLLLLLPLVVPPCC